MSQVVTGKPGAEYGDQTLLADWRLRGGVTRLAGFVEGEIDELAFRKLRAQNDVMQPATAIGGLECWQSGYGLRVETGRRSPNVVHQAHGPTALADERVPGRHWGNGERMLEPLCND